MAGGKRNSTQTTEDEKKIVNGSTVVDDQPTPKTEVNQNKVSDYLPFVFIAVLFSSFFFASVLFYKKFLIKIERFYLDNVEANLVLANQAKKQRDLVKKIQSVYLTPIQKILGIIGIALMVIIIIKVLVKRFILEGEKTGTADEKMKALHFSGEGVWLDNLNRLFKRTMQCFLMETNEGIAILRKANNQEEQKRIIERYMCAFKFLVSEDQDVAETQKIFKGIIHDKMIDFSLAQQIIVNNIHSGEQMNDQAIYKKVEFNNYVVNFIFAFVEIIVSLLVKKNPDENKPDFIKELNNLLKTRLPEEIKNFQKIQDVLLQRPQINSVFCMACADNFSHSNGEFDNCNYGILIPKKGFYYNHETLAYTEYKYQDFAALQKKEKIIRVLPICFNTVHKIRNDSRQNAVLSQEINSDQIKEKVAGFLSKGRQGQVNALDLTFDKSLNVNINDQNQLSSTFQALQDNYFNDVNNNVVGNNNNMNNNFINNNMNGNNNNNNMNDNNNFGNDNNNMFSNQNNMGFNDQFNNNNMNGNNNNNNVFPNQNNNFINNNINGNNNMNNNTV